MKSTSSNCLNLPVHDICQKIYHLSSYFCVALIQLTGDVSCQLHIKLIEKESSRFLCLDKVLFIELIRQLSQLEKVNVEYPCTAERNSYLSVKSTPIPGEYQVKFQSNKLTLDHIAVKYLLAFECIILQRIKDIENRTCNGIDEVDI